MDEALTAELRKDAWDPESMFERYNEDVKKSGVTENLSRNIVNLDYDDIPPKIIELTRFAILDSLGCMLSGFNRGSSQKALRYMRSQGGKPQSTVVVYGDRTHPYYAALVNGAFCRGWSFDDVSAPGLGCGSVVVPAALALAEREFSTGHEVITAVAAGWEVMCRLAAATPNIPARRPLDPVSTFGSFGAAAVAGKLLGFDAFEMENAISLCTGQAAANLRLSSTGGEAARLHAGYAAMYGLRAACLARRGLSGAREMLEGPMGFFMCVAGLNDDDSPVFNVNAVNDGFGEKWIMEGVTFRKYPVESGQLGVLDAVSGLREGHNLRPEDVDGVTIVSNMKKGNWMSSAISVPMDVFCAQHSMAWAVALAMVLGRNDLAAYRLNVPPTGKSAELAEFVNKIRLIDDEVDGGKPSFPKISIKLRNGRTVECASSWPRGNHLHNPMTGEEIESKFRIQATLAEISGAQQDRITLAVQCLEDQDDMTRLMSNLVREG